VQSTDNLAQSGDCWVYGEARVFGTESCSKTPQHFDLSLSGCHSVTVGDRFVSVGCEQHTLEYWLANYKDIGAKHRYTKAQCAAYKRIFGLVKFTKRLKEKEVETLD
jgi:hypothetical protein